MSVRYNTLVTLLKPSIKGLSPFPILSKLVKMTLCKETSWSLISTLFRLLKHENIVESVSDSFQAHKN